MDTQGLINQAMMLPIEDRVLVVDTLLQSIHEQDSNIEKEWTTKAKQRLAEIRKGKVEVIPGEVVFDKIKARFF